MLSVHALAIPGLWRPFPMPMSITPPMQASITALPPPDQWNDHVLAYLGGIGVDHYRGLLHNTVLKMKELLFSSVRHGLQHPSYQQLLDVRNWSGVNPLPLRKNSEYCRCIMGFMSFPYLVIT